MPGPSRCCRNRVRDNGNAMDCLGRWIVGCSTGRAEAEAESEDAVVEVDKHGRLA